MGKIIEINHVTKDYHNGKGIFDLSLDVKKGEIYGLLGPNGAGKTTTIRHILGFQRSDKGEIKVNGIDPWKYSEIVNSGLGYIPGEISFPNFKSGWDLIKQMAKFKSMENIDFAKELVKRLNFDPKGKVKTMSKGMKQKLAIVVAFMNKPNVLILDEPTSGLDPLMQLEFDKIVLEFKQAGATILLSSHIFSEIEKVCDRVSIIKEGKKIMEQSLADIRHDPEKTFKVEFSSASEYKKAHARFVKAKKFHIQNAHEHKNQIIIKFHDEQTNEFTEILSDLKVKYIYQYIKTLEETFMKYYSNNHEYSFKELKTNLLKGKNA